MKYYHMGDNEVEEIKCEIKNLGLIKNRLQTMINKIQFDQDCLIWLIKEKQEGEQ